MVLMQSTNYALRWTHPRLHHLRRPRRTWPARTRRPAGIVAGGTMVLNRRLRNDRLVRTAKKIPDSCNIRDTQICIVPIYLSFKLVVRDRHKVRFSILTGSHQILSRVLCALQQKSNEI